VLFEESILSILPAAFFLLLAPVRVVGLLRKSIKVRAGVLHRAKLVSSSYPDYFSVPYLVI